METVMTYKEWEQINKKRRNKKIKKLVNKIATYTLLVILCSLPLLMLMHWVYFGY